MGFRHYTKRLHCKDAAGAHATEQSEAHQLIKFIQMINDPQRLDCYILVLWTENCLKPEEVMV